MLACSVARLPLSCRRRGSPVPRGSDPRDLGRVVATRVGKQPHDQDHARCVLAVSWAPRARYVGEVLSPAPIGCTA